MRPARCCARNGEYPKRPPLRATSRATVVRCRPNLAANTDHDTNLSSANHENKASRSPIDKAPATMTPPAVGCCNTPASKPDRALTAGTRPLPPALRPGD